MTTLYTFTVHYKFDGDKEVNALQHTIISEGNYERAAHECLKVLSDMLDEFNAVPVYITLRGSIKITVKKSELEYGFKANNVEEFEKRFDALKEIIRQRLINEISKRDIRSM